MDYDGRNSVRSDLNAVNSRSKLGLELAEPSLPCFFHWGFVSKIVAGSTEWHLVEKLSEVMGISSSLLRNYSRSQKAQIF